MSIFPPARPYHRIPMTTLPRFWRSAATVLAMLMTLGATPASAAVSADTPSASLSPLHADADKLTTRSGDELTLQVVKRVNGQGIAGQNIDWAVTGPGKADLAPAHSLTLAQSVNVEAGTALTTFHTAVPGDYVVTASTQKNPGCGKPGCARWVSTRFAVSVVAADSGGDGGSSTGHDGAKMAGVAAAVGGALALVAATAHGSDHNVPPQARDLVAISGDGQAAGANKPLAQALVVRAISGGSNTPGVQVNWSATGGATLSSSVSTTDGNGMASIRVTSIGSGPGTVTITAARADIPSATASFTASVLQPTLNIVSGNGQTGYPGSHSSPLVVQALLGTNPQAQVPVTWAVTGGNASIVSVSNGGVTAGSGYSSAIIQYGSPTGPVQVTATRTDNGLSQIFHLNSAVSNTLIIVNGNGQTACPLQGLPQPLAVRARTNNQPASGVTVDWLASGSTVLNHSSSTTDASGVARAQVNTIGPVYLAYPTTLMVTATRADDPGAVATFQETVPASAMSLVSGNGQTGNIGSTSSPVVVRLLDGCGNPIAHEPVTWTVVYGTATLAAPTTNTNASGFAQVTFTYGTSPQPIGIQASALGGGLTVGFTATATTGNVSAVGGNNQSGQPGTTLPQPLTVQVQPAVAGVPVTFSVASGSATVNPASTQTDANGYASTTVQLGFSTGPVVINAQVGSDIVSFNANVGGTASTLAIVSGNNQMIAPNVASNPMVVRLTSGGSPLGAMTIQWSTSGGTLSANSTTTDAQGQASVTLTPSTAGPVTVVATFPGQTPYTSAQVSFAQNTTLTAVAANNPTDESIAHALDMACTALASTPNRTQQQQDLLNQCLAMSASGEVSGGAVGTAIHQLAPAVAEAQTATATAATTTQFENLAGRMQALRGGAHGVSFAGLAFNNDSGSLGLGDIGQALLGATDDKQEAGAGFSRWGFFGSGQIQRQNASAQASTPGYSFGSNGVTFGVDYRVNDGLVVGGAVGWTHQSTTLDAGQGDMSMHGWSLSGYATWYDKSDWYIDSSLTWSNNSFDSRRVIAYVLPMPGGGSVVVNQNAQSSSGGNDLSAGITFGRDFHHQALAYGFYGKLLYDHSSFDGFQEQLGAGAGTGLGLRVDSRSSTSIATVLGAKFDYNASMKWGVLVPHGEIEWQHEYRTDPNAFTAYFIDDPTNTPILIHGDQTDSDFFHIGAGLSFVFPQGRSAFLLYNRTIGRQGITEYNVSLGFRLEF